MTHPFRLFASNLLALFALLFALTAQAAFTDNTDGTVTDTVTGLMWDKCTWGQTNDTDCSGGAASAFTWAQALAVAVTANAMNSGAGYKNHNDWRLPNKNELASLADRSVYTPAINTTAFPNTLSSWYWSSTTYAPNPASAWAVYFNVGNSSASFKTSNNYVRLVRGGQLFDSFDALTPSALPVLSYSAEPGYGAVGVSPATGTSGTTFWYKVVYTHADNTAPSAIEVCWDASPCGPMSVDSSAAAALHDGNYANGEQYAYTVSGLGVGAHTYYFTASDGVSLVDLPASGTSSGPAVTLPLAISTSSLPNAAAGTAYSQTLAATGGTTPYTWSGTMPAGLTLNPGTGVLSGIPTTAGANVFTVTVTDALNVVVNKVLSINVLGVDLRVSALSSPSVGGSVYTGGPITINDTVINGGTKASSVSGGIKVTYRLGGALIGTRTLANLAAGATNTLIHVHTLTASFAPGVYQLTATVDPNNYQTETNETNNSMTVGTVTVVRSVDLVSNSLVTAATDVYRGATLTLTDTVANTGASPTSVPGGFRVNYYLSKDTTITAADTLLSGRNISSIAAGATNTASKTVSIPAGMAPGVYYLGEIVDSGKAQPESNEANNTRATVGTVTVH